MPQRKPKVVCCSCEKVSATFLPRIYFSILSLSLSSFQVEAPDADLQAGRGQVGFILAKAAQGRERNVWKFHNCKPRSKNFVQSTSQLKSFKGFSCLVVECFNTVKELEFTIIWNVDILQ